MKVRSKAILIGAFAVVGTGLLFASGLTGKRAYNSGLDAPQTQVIKPAYTGTSNPSAQPIDFEKAAAAAVPSVVHIKVTMKAKEISQRGIPGGDDQDDPMGDMFKRFFGDGGRGGHAFAEPEQKASGSGAII